ncbi:MAG: hypothetical protein Q4E22_03220 [Coriobacteriia bacterium]|nr:hypothetical protein [Coriobacteriia bacterium]
MFFEDLAPLVDFSKMKKAEIFDKYFEWKSWHHTSSQFNVTHFYGLNEGALEEDTRALTAEELEAQAEASRIEAEKKKKEEEDYKKLVEERERKEKEFEEKYGFKHDTFAALKLVHPELFENVRIAKKSGKPVYTFVYRGTEFNLREERLEDSTAYGFDAIKELGL